MHGIRNPLSLEGWGMIKKVTMTWENEVLMPWHVIASNQSDNML